MHRKELSLQTPGRGPLELTDRVRRVVAAAGIERGLCHLFVHHTSASLLVCENADPTVLSDLEAWMERAVPDGDRLFEHTAEGPDDMPAHVRSVLCATSLAVPVERGSLDLGTWQGLFLWEHRMGPHRRRVTVSVLG